MNPERLHLQLGDCLEELKKLDDNVIDAIVTDPPYGLSDLKPNQVSDVIMRWATGERDAMPTGRGFMGKSWDVFVPPPAVWDECLRVLKPGGHMAVFAGSRTQDLMGMSIRLAGFEIRDTLAWIYGSGFPKSMDVSKAIDKQLGAEREVIGKVDMRGAYDGIGRVSVGNTGASHVARGGATTEITAPATEEAKQWEGWGTALKPAIEPIILARKPLAESSVVKNVREHGAGAIHIDACRVATDDDTSRPNGVTAIWQEDGTAKAGIGGGSPAGRFPANVLLDEYAAAEMDKQSGVLKSGAHKAGQPRNAKSKSSYTLNDITTYEDTGSVGDASRFFPVFKYQAKAPKKERPVVEREDGSKIQHPTVKPVAVMTWLVKLLTPEDGIVLDPFAGSGTTLQAGHEAGVRAIGIERDPEYAELVHHRLTNMEEK